MQMQMQTPLNEIENQQNLVNLVRFEKAQETWELQNKILEITNLLEESKVAIQELRHVKDQEINELKTREAKIRLKHEDDIEELIRAHECVLSTERFQRNQQEIDLIAKQEENALTITKLARKIKKMEIQHAEESRALLASLKIAEMKSLQTIESWNLAEKEKLLALEEKHEKKLEKLRARIQGLAISETELKIKLAVLEETLKIERIAKTKEFESMRSLLEYKAEQKSQELDNLKIETSEKFANHQTKSQEIIETKTREIESIKAQLEEKEIEIENQRKCNQILRERVSHVEHLLQRMQQHPS